MSGGGELSRRFIEFSAEVTAFSAFDLHGTGHAEIYRSVVTRVVGEGLLTELLDAYDRAVASSAGHAGGEEGSASSSARALAAEVFSDDKLGAIARNIIKLWYAGIWYELPDEWTEEYGALANDGTFTASPQAYPEALLWRAVGSNPPGAKAPGYGSWALPPTFPPIPGEDMAPAAAGQAPAGIGQASARVPVQRGPAAQRDVSEQAEETAR
jgi:hypothetical protein